MHKNFLFDLDQTLLDFHASERKALEIVLKDNGIPFTDEVYQHFKSYNKSLWLELEKKAITRTELFTMRFNDVFKTFGKPLTGIEPLEINSDFISTMAKNGVLMDGAMELVRKIKSQIGGSRIYIVSNGATVNAEGRLKSTVVE